MNQLRNALSAELIKNKHARIKWVTFVAFALAPAFGGVFVFLMQGAGYDSLPGSFKAKAMMLSFEANWDSFLGLLSQAVGVGGVLIFGFVASWLFGREYSDGTAKDLMALPVSRINILNAKYIYYIFWCLALVISNLLIGLLIGFSLQIEGWSTTVFIDNLSTYFTTTILTIIINTPIAFFSLWGRGYLVPLGVVALLLVLAQIFAAVGLGTYFPWAVPGIYSGSGGLPLEMSLNTISYAILIMTGLVGYLGSLAWWKFADQK